MKISNRFTIAIHMLSLMDRLSEQDDFLCTSALMASSVNTNPVIIRRITGMLKNAGLCTVRAGTGGAYPAKDLATVSLLDVYKAVGAVEDMGLFNMHENPNPACPVGANIQEVLNEHLLEAQRAMEEYLSATSVGAVVREITARDDLKGMRQL